MNARQKAKKYKQELEILKKQTIRPLYIERKPLPVETFVSRRAFTGLYIPDEDIKRILLEQLIHDENFVNSIKLEWVHNNEWAVMNPNEVVHFIRLEVVRR